MKMIRSLKSKQAASALLVALTLTAILSLSIAGYLTVVEQQNLLGARSQTWNMSMAVVEAGIEEGLEQLNCNKSNLGADGWGFDGTYYTMNRTLPDGDSYNVKINNTDPNNPVITCLATVTPPTWARNTLGPCFAAMGVPATSSSVRRAVQVRTSKGNLFLAALVAKRNIDLQGNGVYTDSYDSSDPNKSANGKYDSSKYSGDHGDIASNGGLTNSGIVSIQNANIYGVIHTGPQCPVSIGSQGGVGPHGSQTGNVTDAKNEGYILEDANFTFPDTSLPSDYATYLPPSPGTVVTWSNNINSFATTSATLPNPLPWGGAMTNYTPITTYPTPPPAGLTTNNVAASSTYPSPAPAGVTTNYNTQVTTTSGYPAPGSYTGTITTNYAGGSGNQKTYTCSQITSRTYNYTTYNIPFYTYNLYQTNVVYFTNTYDFVLSANTKYVANSLSGKTCVTGPNVTLVLPNGLSGAENITFNQGANVQVYSGGTSVTINGNQYLNPNFYPSSFVVYCTPSVTSFSLNGNGQFTGVLVAPNANVQMNGGGKSNNDFCGCLMVNSCTMNGHFSFHYDESLSHMPSNGRFLISGWDEIDPATF